MENNESPKDNHITFVDVEAFENSNQVKEYVTSIRNRFLPLRFAYIGRAAHTHNQLVTSRDYGLTDIESALISEKLKEMVSQIHTSELNVIDVGSGNGLKAILVLDLLQQRFPKLSYLGIDYSKELQNIARSRISSTNPTLHTEMLQLDFESTALDLVRNHIRKSSGPCLYLLLGQTLGNPRRPESTLANIRKGMLNDDMLIVGVELYNEGRIGEILEHYQNEAFHSAVFTPLSFSGLTKQDGELVISFNHSTHNVEVHFRFARHTIIESNEARVAEFEKGEKLLIFLSHRFTVNELISLFAKCEIHINTIALNNSRSYTLISGMSSGGKHDHGK